LECVEKLLKRQTELEGAMKQPGGARVTEERELQDVKRKLDAMASGILNVPPSMLALRCSLADFAATTATPKRGQTIGRAHRDGGSHD
jgi:hypothetical protein